MQPQGLIKLPLKAWNQLIQASTRNGSFSQSLLLYSFMHRAGVRADHLTIPSVAKACAKLGFLRDGRILHAHAVSMGFQADVFVQTSLLDLYAKCSDLGASRRVFDEMPTRSLVSWNSMISAYGNEYRFEESFKLFREMRIAGVEPSSSTCVSLVSGCVGSDSALWHGLLVHGYGIKVGLDLETCLVNSVINMYGRFGSIGDARSLFKSMKEKSTVTWTSIMGGYVRNGDYGEAFSLFNQMQREQVDVDSIAILNLVSACAFSNSLLIACSVHALLVKKGFDHEGTVSASLVNLYAKCDDLASAQKVFDLVEKKDVSLWTSMIGGHVHSGNLSEALALFQELLNTTIKPNKVTVATILSACASFGSLSMGEKVEEYIKANRLDSYLRVQTALIHMYCKCGNIERAKEIFDGAPTKDVTLWSTMINGYACHGKGKKALALFNEMQRDQSIQPDAVVFTDVLSACSHSGLIEEGLECFDSMRKHYRIEPNMEHYLCIVDLLSRGGYFDSALKIIQQMPVKMRSQVQTPFLSACRTHPKIQLQVSISEQVFNVEPRATGDYILMANIHASLGKWKEAAGIRSLIDKRGLIKEPGWSRIELHS